MSTNYHVTPPPQTYQHPHNVRPQLGETVGSSSAICLRLIGRRTGPLITFHNVRKLCSESHQYFVACFQAHRQEP